MEGINRVSDFGTILQLQGFSVNDGDGIRTVIFLTGCPLRCRWCANPETWTIPPKLAFFREKCTNCGGCRKLCPNGIQFPPDRRAGNQCSACGQCTIACPNGALGLLGKTMSVADIVQKVMRDKIFFQHSNGGVTFSGGEPTYQQGLLRNLVNQFWELGISLDIETCGYFEWEEVKDIFSKMDHVFLDIKHMEPEQHRLLTGVDNRKILGNCINVAALNIPITIRIPLIKHVNNSEQNLRSTAEFILHNIPKATLELLPYHDFGKEKYLALGKEQHLQQFTKPSQQDLVDACEQLRGYGINLVNYK